MRNSTLALACALGWMAGPSLPATTASPASPVDPPPTAADWAALAHLPDWSGIWVPNIADQNAQATSNPPPWTVKVAAEMAAAAAEENAGHPRGLFIDCLPEGMPSWMLISHNAMEILYQPGRVIMLGDSDGNRLRRIYTDGRGHPADPDPSFYGHSIGHWDGQTLVVDTIGVLPQSFLAISEAIGVPNDGDLHVTERIHLEGADRLYDELTITAPRVLSKPWQTTRIFLRDRRRLSEIAEGVCLQGSFAPGKDRDGHAVWVPVPHDNGAPAPVDHRSEQR
jgi:hypothetical protein